MHMSHLSITQEVPLVGACTTSNKCSTLKGYGHTKLVVASNYHRLWIERSYTRGVVDATVWSICQMGVVNVMIENYEQHNYNQNLS